MFHHFSVSCHVGVLPRIYLLISFVGRVCVPEILIFGCFTVFSEIFVCRLPFYFVITHFAVAFISVITCFLTTRFDVKSFLAIGVFLVSRFVNLHFDLSWL